RRRLWRAADRHLFRGGSRGGMGAARREHHRDIDRGRAVLALRLRQARAVRLRPPLHAAHIRRERLRRSIPADGREDLDERYLAQSSALVTPARAISAPWIAMAPVPPRKVWISMLRAGFLRSISVRTVRTTPSVGARTASYKVVRPASAARSQRS